MSNDLSSNVLSKLTIFSKYSKFIPDVKRRETWEEICYRVEQMHIKKYPLLKNDIKKAFKFVKDKKVVPSMRSMQFAGKPIELNNSRIFNCAFTAIQTWKDFSEVILLLLGGCFEKDTEIITRNGDKKISEITTDDEILTYNTDTNEYYWTYPGYVLENPQNKEKIELEFEDGSIIKCTEDHKFYTKNRGWVEAKDLAEFDDIENYFDINITENDISI